MKQIIAICLLVASLAGTLPAAEKPSTVIHVVTIKWKDGTTPEQIQKALDGVNTLAQMYPGIQRIWTRALKVQGPGMTHAVVMEFASEKGLKEYADSAAQKKWYEVYLPIRAESITHDITN
ncbi:MAG: Dabb family protein [Acidobacteria bacterium]|nr:Dabb family protein [Acidobacteriota bacterium]MBI3280113.1 Dabb family protein [Acidobacteriota bacterium]